LARSETPPPTREPKGPPLPPGVWQSLRTFLALGLPGTISLRVGRGGVVDEVEFRAIARRGEPDS
jgi:hypothetical protein